MRIKLLLFISIFLFNVAYSQVGKSPYPIIFVHGLNSGEYTWDSALVRLGQTWAVGNSHNLNFVLNALGGNSGNSTNYINDVIIPLLDENGYVVNSITKSSIYTINFHNFWNQNINDPRIYIHSDDGPGQDESRSNQSAIYKQGFALSILIDSVLRVTGAQKVILVGHSMGGLAIREYLQRKKANGNPKWWIDTNDVINGHKVAKVLTMSTPHLGSNHLFEWIVGINSLSEAMRDLKYSYPISFGIPAPYLFSNSESNIPHDPPTGFLNTDVNCNGYTNDYIEGISNGTSYNSVLPLPDNINYVWLVSKFTTDGDGCVDVDKQWLYDANGTPQPVNIADTMSTNRPHVDIPFYQGVPKDIISIIRGLDEPNSREFAYKISLDTLYSGFITMQPLGIEVDLDFYKVTTTITGDLVVNLSSNNAGVNRFEILSSTGTVLVTKNVTNTSESISYNGDPGDYYIKIVGYSYNNPNLNNYNFSVTSIPQINIGGLVAYYSFNENAIDYSGNNNNGVLSGGVTYTNSFRGQSTKFGGFYSPGHIKVSNSSSLQITSGMSISLWFRLDNAGGMNGYGNYVSTGGGHCLFAKRHDQAGYWTKVYYSSQGVLDYHFGNNYFSSNKISISGSVSGYTLGSWMHIVFVISTTQAKCYINGQLDTLVNLSSFSFANANAQDLYFGKFSDSWYPFNGALDEVRIYNRALTLSEIQSLYDNGGLPVELVNFSSSVNTNSVKLKWVTSSEINNTGFDIERKSFDKENWSKIGFVAGNGNSNERKEFSYTDENLSTGKYNYRLKQIDYNGNYKFYNLSESVIVGVPEKFHLSQNYPNPFNPSTIIKYDVAKQSHVKILVYDILGREVKTLVNELLKPGRYEALFDGSNLTTGVYFYKITAGDFSDTKRMLLIK